MVGIQQRQRLFEHAQRTVAGAFLRLAGEERLGAADLLGQRVADVLAHELVELAGDEGLRRLASGGEKTTRIRAFYNGAVQFELAGQIEAGVGGGSDTTSDVPIAVNPKLRRRLAALEAAARAVA